MNFEKILRICHPGVPALAGGMPAGTAIYGWERLIRLKPGLLSGEIGMQQAPCIRRWNACRDSDRRPGTPDPAEAGTPEWRDRDATGTMHSPVECLLGQRQTAGNA